MKTLRSTIAVAVANRCWIRMLVAASCVGSFAASAGAQQLQPPPLPPAPSVGITFKSAGEPAPIVAPPKDLPNKDLPNNDLGEPALMPGVPLPPPPHMNGDASPRSGQAQLAKLSDEPNVPQGKSGAVKFTLGDHGVKEHADQRSLNAPILPQRAPELVKPSKRHSVSRVVAVADSNDPASIEPSLEREGEGLKIEFSDAPKGERLVASLDLGDGGVMAPAIPAPLSTTTLPRPVPNPRGGIAASPAYIQLDPRLAGSTQAISESIERIHEIEVLGTCMLEAPFVVASVTAKNTDVCNVFHQGNAITVVGGAVGKTTIEIRSVNNERRMVTLRVLPQRQTATRSDVDKVMEMVAQHFPTANLQFRQDDTGTIQIRGTVMSEADARKILELVRKVCLVPVTDKIQVVK